jgi:hypothetical protein
VLLNILGHEVVAENSLLVFVNVLGTWVGMIVDTPTGATSAALGSGVARHAANRPTTDVTSENTVHLTNNLNLNSASGNALVADNHSAGNARSGDATASVNIANIVGSQFGLSDWFGVLYVNVFGSWLGSFGIDTAAGDDPDTKPPVSLPPETQQPFGFVPRTPELTPLPTGTGSYVLGLSDYTGYLGETAAVEPSATYYTAPQTLAATSSRPYTETRIPSGGLEDNSISSLLVAALIVLVGYAITKLKNPFTSSG